MKKLSFLFCLFVLLTAFTCENEPLDNELINQEFQNNDDINNNDDDEIGASTGDYWPRAIGNMWNFDDTFYGDVTYDMVSTEQIDGKTYFKFDELFGQESWLSKTGDTYYVRTAVGGFPVAGYEVSTTYITIRMLVDSAEVGDEWVDNVSYTITYSPIDGSTQEIPDLDYSATYAFEMIGRDLTRTVEGTEYQNVLHVRLTLLASGTATLYDYYYAQDVGLIEFEGEQSSGTLLNYSLN
ncbi:MAG: hypothetical protein GYB35_03055 [Algicola sp.]|nr:hypothetical protein [Algicola sp.]